MRCLQALPVVAAGCQIATAIPTPQDAAKDEDVCSLNARDPESWAKSGAEDQVNKFIKENGELRWLFELERTQNGDASAISCASIGSTGCSTPQNCDGFETKSYYFVLTIMARINEVFNVAHQKLTSSTIKDILAIGKIIDDFKLSVDPAAGNVKYLQTTASGLTMADKIIKQFSDLGPLGDALSFIGGIFSIVGANMPAKVTDYESLERDMEQYLSDVFSQSEKSIERALGTLTGDGDVGDTILGDLLDSVSRMGIEGFNGDYDNNISKILSGGAFLVPAAQSDISAAFEEGYKAVRHGMIGNYLAGLQSYVQKNESTKEGHCESTRRANYWDGSSCYTLLMKGVSGDIKPFHDESIKKMEDDYDLPLKSFMKSVIDCSNSEVDKDDFLIEGDYPKCFLGLAYADYVDGSVNRRCYTNFRNWKDLPSWLFPREEYFTKDCTDFQLPGDDCLINSAPQKDWNEAGLRRYRTHFSGENVDLSGICDYFNADQNCVGNTNTQCWEADEGGYLVDMSFVEGPVGLSENDDCIEGVRDTFQANHNCQTG